jgi:hypothetical protein
MGEDGLHAVQFAFPNDFGTLTMGIEIEHHAGVARHVSGSLLAPIFRVGFGNSRSALACVPMPKTTVHQDDNFLADENQVRGSR